MVSLGSQWFSKAQALAGQSTNPTAAKWFNQAAYNIAKENRNIPTVYGHSSYVSPFELTLPTTTTTGGVTDIPDAGGGLPGGGDDLGGSSEPDWYSLSDAELFNTELENALMLQQLGYSVEFDNQGYMNIDRRNLAVLEPYGAYGLYNNEPLLYEDAFEPYEDFYGNEMYPSYEDLYGYPDGGYRQSTKPLYRGRRKYYNGYRSSGGEYYRGQSSNRRRYPYKKRRYNDYYGN